MQPIMTQSKFPETGHQVDDDGDANAWNNKLYVIASNDGRCLNAAGNKFADLHLDFVQLQHGHLHHHRNR